MEHYRSALAVAALAASGLVTAVHSICPTAFERPNRTGRVVEVTAEAVPAPSAWTDPPRRLRGPEPAELMADSTALLSDRPAIVMPADARMVPRLSSALAAPVADRSTRADPIGDLIRGLDRDSEG